MPELTLPEDQGVCSLWVGGLTPQIVKQDLHDAFYTHGEISDIKMLPERRCAIVTYTMRTAAEEAATQLYRKLSVKGINLKMWWAKSKQTQDNDSAKKDYVTSEPGSAGMPGTVLLGMPGRMLYPSMNPNAMGARPDLNGK